MRPAGASCRHCGKAHRKALLLVLLQVLLLLLVLPVAMQSSLLRPCLAVGQHGLLKLYHKPIRQ